MYLSSAIEDAKTRFGDRRADIVEGDAAKTTRQDERPLHMERPGSQIVADWVLAAASGDRGAWDCLVTRFAPTVWAIARAHRLNSADAADVSQTTWMRLVENLKRIEQPDRVGAWLATTARRESLRLVRLGGRQVPNGDDMDGVPDQRAQPSPERVTGEQQSRLVAELVTKLPPRSQTLLKLLNAESPMSYKEISKALDMPIGSIGPTRARALEQLRRLAMHAGVQPEDVV